MYHLCRLYCYVSSCITRGEDVSHSRNGLLIMHSKLPPELSSCHSTFVILSKAKDLVRCPRRFVANRGLGRGEGGVERGGGPLWSSASGPLQHL